MQINPANLVSLADQFLIAYACTSAVEPSAAALFSIGHAVELHLKAAIACLDPCSDVSTYKHDVARLLRDIQTAQPGLLAGYVLRQRVIDRYLTNIDLPPDARSDPDYDHFNEHRELYWVSTYLMDTKYLFASHGPKLSTKSFGVMILGLNEYWHPFLKEVRDYLRSKDITLSPRLQKALANPNLSPLARGYLAHFT